MQGIEWTGYDGAENIELATEDVHFADLTVPQWFGRKYDWVLSLEVCPQYPTLVIPTASLSALSERPCTHWRGLWTAVDTGHMLSELHTPPQVACSWPGHTSCA